MSFQPDQEPTFKASRYCAESVNTIVDQLMRDEDYTKEEALEWISEAREAVMKGTDPEELLYEIGLEPDFVWALI